MARSVGLNINTACKIATYIMTKQHKMPTAKMWGRVGGARLKRFSTCAASPLIMMKVKKVLTAAVLPLCKESRDGRLNSIKDELTIINELTAAFGGTNIIRPTSSRHWYDIMLRDSEENYSIPCNIKVSSGGTNNALSKKAIVYSFSTLKEHEIPANMSFNKMIELIEKNKRDIRAPEREYHYIYVDKCDKSVVVRSLCDIQNYVSNPQNWMQINWTKEKQVPSHDIHSEDVDDSYNRLTRVLGHSLGKLISSSDALLTIRQ